MVREILSPRDEESPALKALDRLVDVLTGLLTQRGAGAPGIPVREAVVHLIYGFLLRGAATADQSDLKEEVVHTQAMAYRLLLPVVPEET